MKRATKRRLPGEMRAEYNFSGGIRGKYAQRYAAGTNVVVLAPDVAKVFPNSAAVNESLRALASVIGRERRQWRGPTPVR